MALHQGVSLYATVGFEDVTHERQIGMNGERLKKAESIFQLVAELPPDKRVPILTEHCGENTEQ